jgi:hypothetical protein
VTAASWLLDARSVTVASAGGEDVEDVSDAPADLASLPVETAPARNLLLEAAVKAGRCTGAG